MISDIQHLLLGVWKRAEALNILVQWMHSEAELSAIRPVVERLEKDIAEIKKLVSS